jgi:hypothetical protein
MLVHSGDEHFFNHLICFYRSSHFFDGAIVKQLYLVKLKTKLMVKLNLLVMALAALVPLIVGFLWYNPKLFGTAWMRETGMDPETSKPKNMALILGLTYLFSFLMCIPLSFMTIHQFGLNSMLMKEPGFSETGSAMNNYIMDFMSKYGQNFRTFRHGVIHGILGGLLLVMPVIAINAMFEGKKFKYIAINSGYFIVCMAIMGGIICAFT